MKQIRQKQHNSDRRQTSTAVAHGRCASIIIIFDTGKLRSGERITTARPLP